MTALLDRATAAANRRGVYLGRRSARLHVWLYRRTRGRIGGHLPGHPAAPIALVDHTGARTGIRRTTPLIYAEHDGRVLVAASKAGQPTHPAWLHNLVAHPETTVQIGADRRRVRARVTDDDERARLWPLLTARYPPFALFAELAGERTIPVVVFEPPR